MSYWATLSGVALVHLAAMVSPGPNFLVLTQTSISQSRRMGVLTAMGIATGALIWSSSALVGISFLFLKLSWLYQGVRLFGGAYLVYLGIKMWFHAAEPLNTTSNLNEKVRDAWSSFRVGLMTNLTNPQSVVFFGSIFTTLLPPEGPTWVRVAAVAIIVINAIWWHCLVALFFSTGKVQRVYRSAKRLINQVTGSILAILGLRLIFSSSR